MVGSRRVKGAVSARTEGARRATGVGADGAAVGSGALAPGQRFDAIGRWRTSDGGAPINANITWQGETIESPRAFREMLLATGDEVVRTVTEKLLTYALGRGVDHADAPAVRQIVRRLARDDYRWSSLVLGIVESEQFQMRSTPDSTSAAAQE